MPNDKKRKQDVIGNNIFVDNSFYMKDHDSKKYAFDIITFQCSPWKVITETLREMLSEVPLKITPEGIKILTVDTTKSILIYMNLNAENFEYYYCPEPIEIGINMINFYKIMKTITDNNDTFRLFIDNADRNKLGIEFCNKEKKLKTTTYLHLLDIEHINYKIEPPIFDSAISIEASNFKKFCHEKKDLAQFIEIKRLQNKLIMSCEGDFCKQETVIYNTLDNMNEVSGNNQIIQGVFNLKYLCMFAKCANISKDVELYLKNDYPLVVKYNVSSLGEIKFCLSPV
jgi:proliferating cell nuclear antigen